MQLITLLQQMAHELGSMYAGQVKLIVTDEGAGVKSDSFITSRKQET